MPSLLIDACVLLVCATAAVGVRLITVFRWEPMIHEYDPYFNLRATQYLTEHGWTAFFNWQDDRSWYPLGRHVGSTVYPGLMLTARAAHLLLHALHLPVSIETVCIYLAPAFAVFTVLATYALARALRLRGTAALLAAAMVAVVPSYISRSVAGSYDNEAVAIFALVATFAAWVNAVETGTLVWGVLTALAYWYMVASWGGYIFIINIIPLHAAFLVVFCGRYSARLYTAYCTFYVLGSALATTVPFVGWAGIVSRAESAASHATFLLLQAVAAYKLAQRLQLRRGSQSPREQGAVARAQAQPLTAPRPGSKLPLFTVGAVAAVGVAAVLGSWLQTGRINWTGRSLSLLLPTYAKRFQPLIASVAEHQPPPWTSFFFDLGATATLAPAGLWLLCTQPLGVTDGQLFLVVYASAAWYFASSMSRLLLVLAPAACVLAAIAVDELLTVATSSGGGSGISADSSEVKAVESAAKRSAAAPLPSVADSGGDSGNQPSSGCTAAASAPAPDAAFSQLPAPLPWHLRAGLLGGCIALLAYFALHSAHAASSVYSSPTILYTVRQADGSNLLIDDYREAYAWLRANTPEDARVMAWWDYGYHITSMANRTTIVDNNTWNTTHIAIVGRALISSEEDAYSILQSLGIDYVLVVFGGATGRTDDLNKLPWMVRIAEGSFPGGLNESDFRGAGGAFRFDAGASPAMIRSLVYKLCYYRFEGAETRSDKPAGFDALRRSEAHAGRRDIRLRHLEEAFSTDHYGVRIYRVKKAGA